jgi:hypothetical protein
MAALPGWGEVEVRPEVPGADSVVRGAFISGPQHDRQEDGCLQALSKDVNHCISINKKLVAVGDVETVEKSIQGLLMASPRTG